MFTWLRQLPTPRRATTTPSANPNCRPDVESLEDRTTPTASAITSNFNGTAIPAGDSLWFSSVAKVSGVPASGATLHVTGQAISFTANGTQYSLNVPDTTVVLSPTATEAQVTTDAAGNWEVVTPEKFSGNVFLSGLALPLPSGLPGGVKNVTWLGDFTTDTPGVSVNWQWAAATYTQLGPTDASALGVKPSDAPTSLYHNSDHAGTPENFRTDVVGGARGGGGSNYTGSYSGTASVTLNIALQAASLSGYVTGNNQPQAGVQVTLTGTTTQGQQVSLSTTTDSNGMYSFGDLQPGTYSITETPPSTLNGQMYLGTSSTTGEINGQPASDNPSGTSISMVNLTSGDAGTQFDFNNQYGVPG